MEKFWRHVDSSGGLLSCWPWTAGCYNTGYGCFSGRWLAHRLAVQLTFGKIPSGLVVRHTCDNRVCCNPNHLLVGTQRQNMQDRWERGRPNRGSLHGMAKLTEETVRLIRAAVGPQRDVAVRFGVSVPTVSMVKNRRTWTHVE